MGYNRAVETNLAGALPPARLQSGGLFWGYFDVLFRSARYGGLPCAAFRPGNMTARQGQGTPLFRRVECRLVVHQV